MFLRERKSDITPSVYLQLLYSCLLFFCEVSNNSSSHAARKFDGKVKLISVTFHAVKYMYIQYVECMLHPVECLYLHPTISSRHSYSKFAQLKVHLQKIIPLSTEL